MFDRSIAHELTHAVMHSNINYYAIGLLPAFVREGSAELTIGIEDYRKVDIKKLANNPTLLSQALSTDISKVTVSGIENPSYAGGYMFSVTSRAKQATFLSRTRPITQPSELSTAVTMLKILPPTSRSVPARIPIIFTATAPIAQSTAAQVTTAFIIGKTMLKVTAAPAMTSFTTITTTIPQMT